MENTPKDSVSKLDEKQVRSLLSFGLHEPQADEQAEKPKSNKDPSPPDDPIQPTIRLYPKTDSQ